MAEIKRDELERRRMELEFAIEKHAAEAEERQAYTIRTRILRSLPEWSFNPLTPKSATWHSYVNALYSQECHMAL